jgi:hypothetical protein
MFLQIIDLNPYIYINQELLDTQDGFEFVIISKFTNKASAPIPANWIQANERATLFQLELPQFWYNNPEANGIFTYELRNVEFQTILDTGLVKVVSAAPENNTYISNNDDREAIVYFEN